MNPKKLALVILALALTVSIIALVKRPTQHATSDHEGRAPSRSVDSLTEGLVAPRERPIADIRSASEVPLHAGDGAAAEGEVPAFFPSYGGAKVNGRTIEDIALESRDPTEREQAMLQVVLFEKALVREIKRSPLDLLSLEVPRDTARLMSQSGTPIVKVRTDDGEMHYVPCPPRFERKMTELRDLGLALVNSPEYLDATSAGWLSTMPANEAERVTEVVFTPDRTGFLFLDSDGNKIRGVGFNIPGLAHCSHCP